MKGAYALGIVLMLLVFSAGCASFIPDITGAPKATPTKTPTKAPTKTPTPTLFPNVTATINVAATVFVKETTLKVTVIPTPTPKPTPTGYYLIPPEPTIEMVTVTLTPAPSVVGGWKQFQNNDFKVQYPDGWEVVESIAPQPSHILYGETSFNGDSRVIRFESGDGKINFTAKVTDLKVPGYYQQDTGIAWCRNTIAPGTGGVVTNYEKRITVKETPFVSFDVVVPEDSVYLPYAYTERDFGSWSHVYTFRFNTGGNLTEYKAMKDTMFNSLKAQEIKKDPTGEFP